MPVETKIQEPILVKNPHTGRYVNIAPLFNTIELLADSPEGSVYNLKKTVSQIIRQVNLAWDGSATVQKNVNYDLYLLEDMFAAMAEFNQG
jgi:hypothetical protein